jgi:hypothetical protein
MSVSQVWGYDCNECKECDYAYGTEGEAERAEAAHLERSPGCKAGDD